MSNNEENEEQSFEDILNLSREWNNTTDEALKSLSDADKQLNDVLIKMTDLFKDVITSSRTKHVYGPQYGESIASLLRQKTALKKDSVLIAEKRLIQNMKIRDIYKDEQALKKLDDNNKSTANPSEFLGMLESMMNKKAQ